MRRPLDLSNGELPPWINQAVAIARPATAAMTAAIPAAGAFSVGVVAFFSKARALDMATTATLFLKEIPDAGWGAIAAITLGYTAAKTVEVARGQTPPLGRAAPEDGPVTGAPTPDPSAGTEIMQ